MDSGITRPLKDIIGTAFAGGRLGGGGGGGGSMAAAVLEAAP